MAICQCLPDDRVEDVYDLAVKNICEMMGTDRETDSDQLNEFGKKLFGFGWAGVYPSDRFPDFKGPQVYAIMNTDPSFMPGEHWVGLIKHKRNRGYDLLIYDSFGRPADEILPNLKKQFKGRGRIRNTEDDAEQHKQESSCGQRCLAALFIYDQMGIEAFLQL